jgi:thioredoxin reductase (NADPH)
MTSPVFLLVDGADDALGADLERRFGRDYRIAREDAVVDGDRVALLFGDTVDALERLHVRFPGARRVLLVDRGDWSADHPAIAAMALGRIDFHLYRPWRPLERILYPAVSEFLAAWDAGEEPPAVALRIVGDRDAARSHELRDVLSRVAIPYWFHDAASAEGRALIAETGATRLPVVALFDGTVLEDPSHAELMTALGMRSRPDGGRYDVAIVGAGPAGLAAAVYAASEGLRTVVLEPVVPGGQAGTSSLIRNYLGFQRGVSGSDLANRAVEQAWLFGAEFVMDQRATGLSTAGADRVVTTADGSVVTARTVVLATGVAWRRLGVPALEDLLGAGVFYGAAGAEARAMTGKDVYVVGAGNSAGQAVVHLARYADSVTMVVRGDSLGRTMSDYLVTEIGELPNVRVLLGAEVVAGGGRDRLETLTLRSTRDETVPADALFLLIGAEPHTGWLAGAVERDDHGFVRTGRDGRSLLETSIPGVYAAGDVRAGSVKRVAAAVGEGATAIQLVHGYLSDAGIAKRPSGS